MVAGRRRTLRLVCIRIEQRANAPLVVFGVGGRSLREFVAVDVAERKGAELHGYQRGRVEKHIRDIREYLMTDDAMLPNAIVVSLNSASSEFVPISGALRSEWGTPGHLTVVLPKVGESKPGFVIDGQQRMAALATLPPERDLPVIVVGFLSASEELQRNQFVLVNKSRPLPRDLLTELLPQVTALLPVALERQRVAATVVDILRYSPDSPFRGRIRGIGENGDGANISQAALMTAIARSLRRGFLRTVGPEDILDPARAARAVSAYFGGVARTWPDAWDASPWSSRLTHGVGISAMGRLMDEVLPSVAWDGPRAVLSVSRRLDCLEPICAWTGGRWNDLDCAWNSLQNTSQDKRRLADYLLLAYRRAKA